MSVNYSGSTLEPLIQVTIDQGCLHYFETEKPVLTDLNIKVTAGQWTCLLGRSGSGKTTLLRYLAGLIDDQVCFSGQFKVIPNHYLLKEHIAYMAQQDLLMPWLSVLDNVLLSTKLGGLEPPNKTQSRLHAMTLLEQVGLADYANDLPQTLSGGMRQRVALARTLMQNKSVVLMDEPFSSLDAVTRFKLQDLAYNLLSRKTVLLITHDPQEAIRLGHHVYVMQGSPSSAVKVAMPNTDMPRMLTSDSAVLQQKIMTCLSIDGAEN